MLLVGSCALRLYGEYWRGIAMLGMFNTGATTRHGEMAGFNREINLVESYRRPLPFLLCHVAHA